MNLLPHYLTAVASLVLAVGLDYLIGDPWSWLHPVQVMGWGIAQWRDLTWRFLPEGGGRKFSGILLTFTLAGLSGGTTWLLIYLSGEVAETLAIAMEGICLASCLGARSLHRAAIEVLTPLQSHDLVHGRLMLNRYVGRDTENLSQAEILRALVETIAENTTDGAIAPLFFGIIGGAPLAMAYKAVSTLDSMVGYLDPPFTNLGWCSAKLDDLLTWLPCRFTVIAVAIFSGKPLQVWRLCQRDAPQDPSPNSGWSECVFAATLGVQLGGWNYYRNQPKFKPLLAEPHQPLEVATVIQALTLMRASVIGLLGIGIPLKLLIALS
ncbi:MAG: adenosylcobinamide-phosphate synthase CbiB [Pseudanabaenaceae cyanobacterium bins.68]|nr:adenosylcobinamide-phosphate synthase CbiB [Pseudanabaenaceae cyanobacterium bins.68]